MSHSPEVGALGHKRRELESLRAELEARVGEIRSQQKKRRGEPVSASSPAAASGPLTRPHPDPSLSGAAASGGHGIEDVENHIRLELEELVRLTAESTASVAWLDPSLPVGVGSLWKCA